MHGHALRLLAEEEHIDMWADLAVGAIYGVLKRLAAEGLIHELRTEREGNYPERQVYEITAAGREALGSIRQTTLDHVGLRPDPVDLAFARLGPDDVDRLGETIDSRLRKLRTLLESTEAHVAAITQYLTVMERHVMRHQAVRLRAEIEWHESLLVTLHDITEDEKSRRARPE
ncbi:MAG: PadR family transcriptional regulator [Rhodoglobus sp.]|nr:PadR family transcriptional regulator [Rhodoglobus sp.]